MSAAVLVLLGCAAIAGNTRAALAQPQVQPQQAELVRRDITIDVQVLSADGSALADAVIFVYTKYAWAFGITGADGRAQIELDPAVGSDDLVIAELHDGSDLQDISDVRSQELYTRANELRDQYAFRHQYPLAINDANDSYSMTIQAAESSRLTGAFVGHGATLPLFVVGGLAKPVGRQFRTDETGQFSILIEKGTPTQLLYTSSTRQSRIFDITAAQAAANIELGQVDVELFVNDSTLAVQYVHPGRVLLDPDRLFIVNGQITMMEASGGYFMTFVADPELAFAVDAEWNVNQTPPQVPAGTYYLVAGSHWQTEVEALRLALLDGRQAALDAAGVVSVTVSPTQPGDVQLDALANTTAILSVAGDLVD